MDNEQHQPDAAIVELRTVYRLAWEFANCGAPSSPGTRISVGGMFEEMAKQIADRQEQQGLKRLRKQSDRHDRFFCAALTGLLAFGKYSFDDKDATAADCIPVARHMAHMCCAQEPEVDMRPGKKWEYTDETQKAGGGLIATACFACSAVLRPEDSYCFDCGIRQPRL